MPGITAEITLLPPGHSARNGPLVGKWFTCPIVVDGALYEARFDLEPARTIQLGSTVTLDATFSDPDAVLKVLTVGKSFTLWTRGAIGHGKVLTIRAR